ncbi:periostin-like [Artemia franciscana]|uniref:periostin-like n=1 Tax=Artemia franciscana TaxID=6661 RepID=UPI0032DA2C13
MEEAAFVNKIRSAGQIAFTIFAPSDEAFEKITPQRRRAIMNDKEARSALLQNHVLPHPLCFPAITEEYNMKTLSGKRLKIDCDKKGVTVSGNGMKNEYILGNNGVIHISNTVLLPNRAKSLLELAQDEGLNTFLELAKIGGFEESLSKFGDYTIFVPSEAAFAALPQSEMDEIQSSQEAAQQFVRYHGTQGRLFTNKIKDSQFFTEEVVLYSQKSSVQQQH